MRPVMLALSTFRQSDRAVELAAARAVETKELVIAFIVDVNLARYLMMTDVGLYPKLRDRCEKELLEENRRRAEEEMHLIAERARREIPSVRTFTVTGRFGIECMKIVESENPEMIVTTRSKRPDWTRKFFGSPVDYLIKHAGCPVIEA